MAQTGYTPILIYSSTTASQAPAAGNLTNSTLGSELAINITDGKLFYKDNANAIQVIGWKTTPTTAGGTGLTSYTAGDLLYYATGTTLSQLAIGASGRWLGSSGTAPQWNAPAALTKTDDTNVTLTLGGSASTALLNAASLTLGWTGTLATTRGGTGLSSFTANAVVYSSSTSALATGSVLFFDGTNFGVGGITQSGTANKSFVKDSSKFQQALIDTTAQAAGVGGALNLGGNYRTTGDAQAFTRIAAEKSNSTDNNYAYNLGFYTTANGGASFGVKNMTMFSSGGISIGNTTDPGSTNLSVSGTVGGGITGSSTIHRFYVNNNNDWTARFVNTNSTSPYGITINYDNATPNGNQNAFWNCGDSTATRGYLQSNGGLANYSANNTNLSDRNEKTNFASSRSYLDVICAIPVQTFNYIDQNLVDDPGLTLGVVAQDVQAVAPELVTENNWGTKENPKMRLSIYQTDLQYALMKCIQELKQQLDELRGNKP